jgi:hypothetical protein
MKNSHAELASEEVEFLRRERALELNRNAAARQQLLARYAEVWDTEELARDFEVIGFAAPYVVVRRKADRQIGSLEFQHHPRFYFNFEVDSAA